MPTSVVLALIDEELAKAGVSRERFVALGRADELDDDRLRDLWLMLGPVLDER
ncbi:MAG: hypothetical protein C0P77_010610 [Thermoanaerobacterales bacterium]